MFNVTKSCREINVICRKHSNHRESVFYDREQSLKCQLVKGKPLDSMNGPVCTEMWRLGPTTFLVFRKSSEQDVYLGSAGD